ncbi:MAG: poly(A) polymerase [Bdellovibrionales bacterium]|nr:poly(A) polymerase [Bdellovibrionales bacterium]
MTENKIPLLSPEWIDHRAFRIVEALQKKGFKTYLVGGCVRDLLLGIEPKDFDIATDAHPSDVKRIIPQSYIIGKRFRLVLVKRQEQQFEVATFRRDIREEEKLDEEVPIGDNFWGSPEQDALRRDFTINALFYDPIKNEVIDYANGRQDLKKGCIRIIGNPTERLIEDPIRILRAIRLAHKIRFSIESDLRQAIATTAESLSLSALPRRREEFLKFLRLKEPLLPFLDCHDLGVLKYISPTLDKVILETESRKIFVRYMQNYHDYPLNKEQPVELFAMFVLAVLRSSFFKDHDVPIKAKDILENEQIKVFMKDELGMFNYEQNALAKSLQMQSVLQKTDSFDKKGVRRRLAVLKNEAFQLALAIAERDHSLSCEQSLYWKQQYKTFMPQIFEEQGFKNKKRRKKTRFKKRQTNNLAKTKA